MKRTDVSADGSTRKCRRQARLKSADSADAQQSEMLELLLLRTQVVADIFSALKEEK